VFYGFHLVWAFLIDTYPASICLSVRPSVSMSVVNFSHFHILSQNHCMSCHQIYNNCFKFGGKTEKLRQDENHITLFFGILGLLIWKRVWLATNFQINHACYTMQTAAIFDGRQDSWPPFQQRYRRDSTSTKVSIDLVVISILSGFVRSLRFPPPVKLITTIYSLWSNWVLLELK
jgi:hypothetical protein